jgi:DNA (cytosine-5)-methyltransferase 1
VDTTKTITHVSLCSGYDGIGLGLRRIWPNVREIAHVEIEAFAAANLVATMEEGELGEAPVWTDLKTFPAWAFRGCVDILSAGFPCQPFSAAGKGGADADPRHLWPHVRQAIGLIRPGMVVLENVEGIISSKLKGNDWNDPEGTPVLLHVLRELERTGYRCTWGVFSASEVGASHQRKRVFIVGVEDTPSESSGYFQREIARGIGWESSVQQRDGEGSTVRAGSAGEAVADPRNKGSSSSRGESQHEGAIKQSFHNFSEATRWPTHPGEEQYDWEEPRTLEPGLGRAIARTFSRVDPTTHRVDRLRLLGNGVVPGTCERAVRVLLNQLLTHQ